MLECKNVFLHWGENKDQLIELIWKYYGETQVCINFPATITVKVKTHTLSPATYSNAIMKKLYETYFLGTDVGIVSKDIDVLVSLI